MRTVSHETKITQVSFHVRETQSYRMRQEDKRKRAQLLCAKGGISRGGSVETVKKLSGYRMYARGKQETGPQTGIG